LQFSSSAAGKPHPRQAAADTPQIYEDDVGSEKLDSPEIQMIANL
jgi:hypothetical protein